MNIHVNKLEIVCAHQKLAERQHSANAVEVQKNLSFDLAFPARAERRREMRRQGYFARKPSKVERISEKTRRKLGKKGT